MKADWLCKLGGQPCGPFTVDQLRQLAAAGTVTATTEIRREKDPRWFLAGKVPGLLTPSGAMPTPAGSSTGARIDAAAPAKPRPRPATAVVAATAAKPPAGVPVGQPVVSASAAARSSSQAVQNSGDMNLVFSTEAPSSAKTTKVDSTPGSKKRPGSNRTLLVVATLGGACALVALIGAAVIFFSSQSSNQAIAAADEKPGEADAAAAADVEPLAPEAESNPVALTAESAEGEGESFIAPAKERPTASEPGGSAKEALATIQTWSSLANRAQLGLKGIARFEVTSVWLASDATGKRVLPKSIASKPPADGSTAAVAAVPAKLEPAVKPRFVFAEVKISNTGDDPVKYLGWNAPAESGALLVDESGASLAFVPLAETPKVTRLAATTIPPGGSVTDTLVFRAPKTAVQKLRVALPKRALSTLAKGYFGVEVPQETLFQSSSAMLANRNLTGPGDAAARDEFVELQRQLLPDEAPAPAIQPAMAAAAATSPAPADDKAAEEMASKPPESKLQSAEAFDKFLRDRDTEEDGDKEPTE